MPSRAASKFPPLNGYFSNQLCSPRAYFLTVLSERLVVSSCAALLIEKIPPLCVETKLFLKKCLKASFTIFNTYPIQYQAFEGLYV